MKVQRQASQRPMQASLLLSKGGPKAANSRARASDWGRGKGVQPLCKRWIFALCP